MKDEKKNNFEETFWVKTDVGNVIDSDWNEYTAVSSQTLILLPTTSMHVEIRTPSIFAGRTLK